MVFKPTKLYCYVDETGQDTKGRLFIVATLILAQEPSEMDLTLRQCEMKSGKKEKKWGQARYSEKLAYMNLISKRLHPANAIHYRIFKYEKDYAVCTIETIASLLKDNSSGRVAIIIDGLTKTLEPNYRKALTQLGVS